MAYFRIDEPNKDRKWIKSVDNENGTLEFSKSRNGSYSRSDGIIANSELQRLKFHFTEKYPELQYLVKDSSW
jgi:hypothetical protein